MNHLSSAIEEAPSDGSDPHDYESEFVLWVESQLDILRSKKFAQLDLENLIEELDSIGKSEKRELRSRKRSMNLSLVTCN